ncbi:MAG: diguanylate cyclase [Treponema sp.]|nr:diguanylate cyclase [Treponema sp.]
MCTVIIGAGSFHTITRVANIKVDAFQLTELSDTANSLVEAHHVWRYNLAWAFLYDRPFGGGLNPHTCIYGRWLEGPMPQMIDDPQVFALIDAIFQPHYDLHVQGGIALGLREEGRMEEALNLLYRVVFPAGVESTDRINALRDRYVELRDFHMEDLEGLISLATMILIIIFLVCLVVFLVLGFLITRSILVPVRGIENVASALSKMDFTIDIQKTEVDEIGDIQEELINIRDNLKKGIDDMKTSHDENMRIVKEEQAAFRERTSAILNASPMVCAIYDADGNVVDVNKEVENLLGIPDQKMFVTDLNRFTPKQQPDGIDSSQKSAEMLRKVLREGSARYEWTYLHSDGSLVPTEEILHRINVDGKPHAIAYSRDLREYYREREKERIVQGKLQAMMGQFNEYVEEQSSSVTTSSSATEEMIANIRSVTDTLAKNTHNVRELQESSIAGHNSLSEVVADIQGIARESESLLEINAVMQNIASQTNLLSMNASIEAAHAGESGRGFAVVADEIRKLAESSSKQSKTISGVLKSIKGSIDKITKSTDAVLGKFNAIEDGVKTVSIQEDSILNAMEEQGRGSKQILQAIGSVNEITHKVKEAARRMVETSKENMHKADDSETQAFTDDLTGVRNKEYFMETAEQELRYCVGENREFNLVMFSIDGLRKITDLHGNEVRDEALKILTQRARNGLKQGTLVARYGEKEFVITLPNVRYQTAVKLAEQIQKKVKDAPFAAKGRQLDVRISFGVASKTDSCKTLAGIIDNAAKALSNTKVTKKEKLAV